MLPIMQLLRFEKSLHLVGHRVVGVVAKVGRDLVGGRQQGRARPTRYVQDFLIRSLLRHLHRVDCTHFKALFCRSMCNKELAYSYVRDDPPQLVRSAG